MDITIDINFSFDKMDTKINIRLRFDNIDIRININNGLLTRWWWCWSNIHQLTMQLPHSITLMLPFVRCSCFLNFIFITKSTILCGWMLRKTTQKCSPWENPENWTWFKLPVGEYCARIRISEDVCTEIGSEIIVTNKMCSWMWHSKHSSLAPFVELLTQLWFHHWHLCQKHFRIPDEKNWVCSKKEEKVKWI